MNAHDAFRFDRAHEVTRDDTLLWLNQRRCAIIKHNRIKTGATGLIRWGTPKICCVLLDKQYKFVYVATDCLQVFIDIYYPEPATRAQVASDLSHFHRGMTPSMHQEYNEFIQDNNIVCYMWRDQFSRHIISFPKRSDFVMFNMRFDGDDRLEERLRQHDPFGLVSAKNT